MSQLMKLPCTKDELDRIQRYLTPDQRVKVLLEEANRIADDSISKLMVVGYVKCDRPGELEEADCPECGQPIQSFSNPYIGFLTDGTFVYVCSTCATSE